MPDPRLHLLHLASPALPVGAYAYSQGLEYAIEAEWVENETLPGWLRDGLTLGLAQLDLPVILRVFDAAKLGDMTRINDLNDRLLANRETAELLLEDQQIGKALFRLLKSLHVAPLPKLHQPPGHAVSFALACAFWDIERDDALLGYCYSWLENQITAATKLVPLGQSRAQEVLLELLHSVATACEHAREVNDDDLGSSLPGLALASCRHERQHTRLFRS